MKTKLAFVFVLILCFSTLAFGENWTIELRPAMNMPTGDFNDAELESGIGVDARIAYRVMPHLDVFTGWSWTNFAGENDLDFEETGYDLGVRFIHPFASYSFHYLLEGAATYKHVELEDGDDIIGDSDHALGFQLGAGIVYKISPKISLQPTVRYNTLTSEVEFDDLDITSEGDLNYISLGLGIAWNF
ncbi:MAG: porin family protein [Candidatus Cloacimonetes bacterium]|nr:porin family protein [Candidatus Cloacimonadota bacterium]MCF7814719.1 porin family protein [Candidatus Cloacimonadota bacterium]MCF7869140.1 porin family protein [Candidatus Cloacimonadota bacterium]MCF7884591.1 porin family protein [Candidatus Cloacimonadota bacterium]